MGRVTALSSLGTESLSGAVTSSWPIRLGHTPGRIYVQGGERDWAKIRKWAWTFVHFCRYAVKCDRKGLSPERWSDNSWIKIKHGKRDIKPISGWSCQDILNWDIVLLASQGIISDIFSRGLCSEEEYMLCYSIQQLASDWWNLKISFGPMLKQTCQFGSFAGLIHISGITILRSAGVCVWIEWGSASKWYS